MLLDTVDLSLFCVIMMHLRLFLRKTIYASARSLDKEVKQ